MTLSDTPYHFRFVCETLSRPEIGDQSSHGLPVQGQDETLLLKDERGETQARCSLWWSEAPPLPGHRVGAVGHYFADSAAAGGALLKRALERLRSERCTLAVGPMDGNTWRRYRLVTTRGSEPHFFLEPNNPDDWPLHFEGAGFLPIAHYYSALVPDLREEDERVPRVEKRLTESGVLIRPLCMDAFEEELLAVHQLSLSSFRRNFLYTDLSAGDFVAQYLPVRPMLVPELVLLAELEGRVVGFVFAVPDLAQTQRGEKVDTVILKTVAVEPGRHVAGLGAVLVARIHREALRLGFRRVIHALMHENNPSLNLSARQADPMRRYTLFARPLQ